MAFTSVNQSMACCLVKVCMAFCCCTCESSQCHAYFALICHVVKQGTCHRHARAAIVQVLLQERVHHARRRHTHCQPELFAAALVAVRADQLSAARDRYGGFRRRFRWHRCGRSAASGTDFGLARHVQSRSTRVLTGSIHIWGTCQPRCTRGHAKKSVRMSADAADRGKRAGCASARPSSAAVFSVFPDQAAQVLGSCLAAAVPTALVQLVVARSCGGSPYLGSAAAKISRWSGAAAIRCPCVDNNNAMI